MIKNKTKSEYIVVSRGYGFIKECKDIKSVKKTVEKLKPKYKKPMVYKKINKKNMKVISLDGISSIINLSKYQASGNRARSSLHLKTRDLLLNIFPLYNITEEVSIVITKGVTQYLDFLIYSKKLAIEVNGEQHYKFSPHFHGTMANFVKQKKKDRLKKEWCALNGIDLIQLPYNEELDEWRNRIENRVSC